MKEVTIVYEGRAVPLNSFRTFVYGVDGDKKLANSWMEYQNLIGSGLWFSNLEEAEKNKISKDINSESISLDTNKGRAHKKDAQHADHCT